MPEGQVRKRGRPRGSVSLTAEKAELIIKLVAGGASLTSAAKTADVPVRTLYDWLARGEGRSSAPATPKLRAFARAVRKAQGEATVSAEVRVHQDQPGAWLRMEAARAERSRGDESGREEVSSPEEITALASRLRDLLLYTDPTEKVLPCPNPRCKCAFHRERTPEELKATQGLAERKRPRRKEAS